MLSAGYIVALHPAKFLVIVYQIPAPAVGDGADLGAAGDAAQLIIVRAGTGAHVEGILRCYGIVNVIVINLVGQTLSSLYLVRSSQLPLGSGVGEGVGLGR